MNWLKKSSPDGFFTGVVVVAGEGDEAPPDESPPEEADRPLPPSPKPAGGCGGRWGSLTEREVVPAPKPPTPPLLSPPERKSGWGGVGEGDFGGSGGDDEEEE